jgi:hypothetical protein
MKKVNYQKRKNQKLFQTLENPDTLFLSQTQNYIPLYQRFFQLSEKNYNSINLNHKWYLSSLKEKKDENIYDCVLEKVEEDEKKSSQKTTKEVFFKLAPLLDPFKYLIGKYNIQEKRLFTLPKWNSTEENTMPKIINVNNLAYIDSFFLYLNSLLIHQYDFVHGVDFYGTFLAIKKNYQINVFDDLEYLVQSEFFIKNKEVLFKIDNYDHLLEDESKGNVSQSKKTKILIDTDSTVELSVENLGLHLLEESPPLMNSTESKEECMVECTDDFSKVDFSVFNEKATTLKSHSTCSSRTSHTESVESFVDILEEAVLIEDEEKENENVERENVENKDELGSNESIRDTEEEREYNSEEEGEEDDDDFETVTDYDNEFEDDDEDEDFEEEEKIHVTLPEFPVQVICMENCLSTLDQLILDEELSEEEWFSALMQVIMILITFQKVFSFTHNDLHTNNIMYVETEKKFLYYFYEEKYYKVPTFGRIFKIIDFGRSIYHYDGKIFCSDSFEEGGDASTQYNTEPYLNEKKPRIEPNYSFDLCRLACSIFDYVVEDFGKIGDLTNCSPITRLIVEWCLDDKGVNVLYKNNGEERYPDFKLYKMIARCVHNHTPQAQLQREEFKRFQIHKKDVPLKKCKILNIDQMPIA